jgi:hypothetical protein
MILRKKAPERPTAVISAILVARLNYALSLAQTKSPQIVQEAKTATCSNVVVTGGTATFKCDGLTEEQANLLRDVPALLTRLLKSQQLDTKEILSRLDTCVDQGAARSLSQETQIKLKTLLQLPIPNEFSISIMAANSTPESSRYAEQLRNAFVASGWTANPVGYPMETASYQLPSGLRIIVFDGGSAPGKMVQQAFTVLGIKADYFLSREKMDPNSIRMEVWQKPVE